MNADDFRALALSLPEATAGHHNGHADMRVGGKVFASLNAAETHAHLHLDPIHRPILQARHPGHLSPLAGAWGRAGWTRLPLAGAPAALIHAALHGAFRRTAPAELQVRHGLDTDEPSTPAVELRTGTFGDLEAVLRLDEDATALYSTVGLEVLLSREHPFSLDEERRWGRDLAEGRGILAFVEDALVGFITCHDVDGEAYLDQLSVRRSHGRQGIGRRLLTRAKIFAGLGGHAPRPLWLTTYRHVPWNQPFYERHGFVAVPERDCSPGIRDILQSQRDALPAPEERVALRWTHSTSALPGRRGAAAGGSVDRIP